MVEDAPEFVTLAGRRVPVVSVHDGEAGLLDNIGSILVPVRGGPHAELAMRLARDLGRRFGAQVVVLHVVPKGIGERAGRDRGQPARAGEARRRGAAAAIDWRELWDSTAEAPAADGRVTSAG